MKSLSVRIVLHKYPGPEIKNSHLDIFLLFSDKKYSENDRVLINLKADSKQKDKLLKGFPVKVLRQENHRFFYRNYEGPVSDNRGSIVEILKKNDFNLEGEITAVEALPEVGKYLSFTLKENSIVLNNLEASKQN